MSICAPYLVTRVSSRVSRYALLGLSDRQATSCGLRVSGLTSIPTRGACPQVTAGCAGASDNVSRAHNYAYTSRSLDRACICIKPKQVPPSCSQTLLTISPFWSCHREWWLRRTVDRRIVAINYLIAVYAVCILGRARQQRQQQAAGLDVRGHIVSFGRFVWRRFKPRGRYHTRRVVAQFPYRRSA
jgi:hypothetical protein